MNLPDDLAARVARDYGLEPQLLAGPGLGSSVGARCRTLGIESPAEYFERLRNDSAELATLVDSLLIPESWFFRDGLPFAQLRAWVQHHLPLPKGTPLRVLSLPCAAGQEAYSIAITLLEAGLTPEQFQILAGDLSPTFIAQAEEGLYRELSFRGVPPVDLGVYFDAMGDGRRRVKAVLKERVQFHRMNLLDAWSYQGFGPYEVIFCRNALIYFDQQGRRRAVAGLEGALAPGGQLFVGHADAIHRITDRFVRTGLPGAFCYQRRVPGGVGSHSGEQPSPGSPPRPARPKVRTPVRPKAAQSAASERTPDGVVLANAERAAKLADLGKLEEAEAVCRGELNGRGADSVPLTFLLGEILLAQRRLEQAERQFRRVLYLAPTHREALNRLALLAEQRGDHAAAAVWRRRAARRKPQGEEAVRS